MNYEVILLHPAKEFYLSLEIKMRAKVSRTLKLLEEFGPYLSEPHCKNITGVKKLNELRVKQGNNICRFFYFHSKNKTYVTTSGFIKKDRKTDKKEIIKALDLMNKYLEELNE